MSKTIAIIPARGGSKRLPGKNTRLLGDIPLLAHSIVYAQKNHAIIDDVYVSTNDEAIKGTAIEYGARVIDRPGELATDSSATVSALAHALEIINDKVENVVLLQPTNPLRPRLLLQESFKEFQQGGYDSLMTVTPDFHKFGKIDKGAFIPFNYSFGQRSQDMEPLYYENGLLYITKPSLISQHKIQSKNGCPFIVDHPFASVDIDTDDDFQYAQYILTQYSKDKNEPDL